MNEKRCVCVRVCVLAPQARAKARWARLMRAEKAAEADSVGDVAAIVAAPYGGEGMFDDSDDDEPEGASSADDDDNAADACSHAWRPQARAVACCCFCLFGGCALARSGTGKNS